MGRRLAGPAAGVAAAALAALYPAMVMNDSVGLSESLTGPTVAAALLAALRLRERPGPGARSCWALLIGLATLNRSEALLLAAAARRAGAPAQPKPAARRAALLATALTIAPWTIRNLTTFDRTTFLTTGDGSVFKGANCPGTYRGGFTGGWDIRCLAAVRMPRDESVLPSAGAATRSTTRRTTRGRVPVVVAARVARTFALYPSPSRQVNDLHFLEGRPRWLVWVALAAYAAVAALAIAGIVGLRAQPGVVAIMLAPVALVVVTSALGYGTWRFRQAAEVALVTLAGVAAGAAGGEGAPCLGRFGSPPRARCSPRRPCSPSSPGGYFGVIHGQVGVLVTALAWLLAATVILFEPRPFPSSRPAVVALAGLTAFVAWSALSLLWSPLRDPGLADVERSALYLAAFLVGCSALRGGATVRAVAPALLAGIAIVCLYALSTRLLPGIVDSTSGFRAGSRLDQPLTYWNALGALAAMGLMLAIGTASDPRRSERFRVAAMALVPALGLTLFLTISRGAHVAAVLRGGGARAGRAQPPGGRLDGARLRGCGAHGGDRRPLPRRRRAGRWGRHTRAPGPRGARPARRHLGAAALGQLLLARLEARGTTWTAALRRTACAQRAWRASALVAVALGVAAFAGGQAKPSPRDSLAKGPQRFRTIETNRWRYWRVAFDSFADAAAHRQRHARVRGGLAQAARHRRGRAGRPLALHRDADRAGPAGTPVPAGCSSAARGSRSGAIG